MHLDPCTVDCRLVRRMALVVDYLLRIGMLYVISWREDTLKIGTCCSIDMSPAGADRGGSDAKIVQKALQSHRGLCLSRGLVS